MVSFKRVLQDIKSLKIQGAQHVALASLDAIKDVVKTSKAVSIAALRGHMVNAQRDLVRTRPTEPAMRNALHLSLQPLLHAHKSIGVADAKKQALEAIRLAREHLLSSPKVIAQIGARKVRKNMAVYTHCHSSTVTSLLIEAHKQGVSFVVHTTETRPRYQGRRTAQELASARIHVEHYVDSAMPYALRAADLVLLGVDAITAEGFVANKVGTSLACNLARRYGVPVYFCMDSWKFDPLTLHGKMEEIERRDPREVWEGAPKGIHINNIAFDLVAPDAVAGIISEFGVLSVDSFLDAVLRKNPWMQEMNG